MNLKLSYKNKSFAADISKFNTPGCKPSRVRLLRNRAQQEFEGKFLSLLSFSVHRTKWTLSICEFVLINITRLCALPGI